jgi:GAF domain-containing protein
VSGSWGDEFRDVAARLDQPAAMLRQLLHDVVARAVAAVGAAEGSILVPDADGQRLRFFVCVGPAAGKLIGLHVPLEGSIAGYVFNTGQMTAVGDLTGEHHSSFYAEIDKTSGVATRTYLVVPILLRGRAQGVATYVNRPTGPPYQPFQQDEMAKAQVFAGVEAVLLRSWERTGQLAQLAGQDLAAALGTAGPDQTATLDAGRHADPWTRVVRDLDSLAEEDQALCVEFVALLARHRQGRSG